jgi:beta-lactamase class D
MRILFMLMVLSAIAASQKLFAEVQQGWEQVFEHYDAVGTMVIVDQRNQESREMVFDRDRAGERFSPASTFKIPHTLFALDAGVVSDEFQVFGWDGVERSFAGHNQDQDLRSAMRSSAIWVYQGFAQAIGEQKALAYLEQTEYGNMKVSSDAGDYWVYGDLAISAFEQIDFLKRLYRNDLPIDTGHQRLVKDLIINEAGYTWILRAKTGWDGNLGWWVGWVEWPSGPVFFALNIDTPHRLDDLAKRQRIGRAILRSIDALPAG